VVENVMADLIPLPVAALDPSSPARSLLDHIAVQGDDLRKAANQLGDDLNQSLGGSKLPWDKGQRIGETLTYQLSSIARRVLGGLQRDSDCGERAEAAWQQAARQAAYDVAAPALGSTPPQAVLGRVKEDKNRKHRYCEAIAERQYKRRVREILGDHELSPLEHADGE
jgi:CRISPR system Cascade subunit CasA